jgi:hypothetical protein
MVKLIAIKHKKNYYLFIYRKLIIYEGNHTVLSILL